MRRRFYDRRDAQVRRRGREQGAVIVLFAVCLLVMVGILGLAIDSSIAYFSKARLSLAADGAVLAAADSYMSDTRNGVDKATRDRNASDVAAAYFSANYPRLFLHGNEPKGSLRSLETDEATALQYDAKSENPLTFGTVLLSSPLTPVTSPEVEIQHIASNANIAMVLDQSSSVTPRGWRNIAEILKKNYISHLDEKSTRISIIPFGDPEETKVELPFDKNKNGFDRAVVDHALDDGFVAGNTALCKALHLAVDQFGLLAGTTPRQNVILLVTDGIPTDDAADYCFDPVSKTHGIDNYIKEAIHKKDIAVYSIGWGVEFRGEQPQNYLKCLTGDPRYPADHCNVDIGVYDDSKYCLGDTRVDPVHPVYPDLTSCITHAAGGVDSKVLTR